MVDMLLVDDLKKKLIQIIIESNAYDVQKNYINIDKVWGDPAKLSKISDLLKSLIENIYPNKDFKLLAPDKEIVVFGILPIACLLSEKMNVPLVIWKENARPLTGESIFFNLDKNDKLLILHDVTTWGGTIRRILNELESTNKVIGVFSLVDKGELKESFNVPYEYVVNISDFRIEVQKDYEGKR